MTAQSGNAGAPRRFASRQLIVALRQGSPASMSIASAAAASPGAAGVAPTGASTLGALLAQEHVSLTPLFGPTEDRVRASAMRSLEAAPASAGHIGDDLARYYRVVGGDDRLDELAAKLQQEPLVEAAYVKPADEPPHRMSTFTTPVAAVAPTTPNFRSRQSYLDRAPGGIDAVFAATVPGGGGAGVRVIDIEGDWRFSHEDLLQEQGGLLAGVAADDVHWRNHGTAVVGVIGADRNAGGVTGIVPDAHVSAASIFGDDWSSSQAIRTAAEALRPGDVLLIELHRPGPRHNFQSRPDQDGYIAIEWWPDDFAAIAFAASKGIVVVEAAGNGSEDLDDQIYDQRPNGFPTTWVNPFKRPAGGDSGAVMVGAGAPPRGTHGQDHGPDRSRLDFSNFGASIDAQGWGREVTTTGYGDLQGGPTEDTWYTDRFSGTSSASPIVVGAVAAIQGARLAAGKVPLGPEAMRAVLRETGSAQQDAPGRPASQRIGNLPDLRAALAHLGLGSGETDRIRKRLLRFWDDASPLGPKAIEARCDAGLSLADIAIDEIDAVGFINEYNAIIRDEGGAGPPVTPKEARKWHAVPMLKIIETIGERAKP